MNTDKERTLREQSRRNPFWVCLAVFLLLTCDYAYRLSSLLEQREQLRQVMLVQAQNMGALEQAKNIESRIESFSLDLLQVARTNTAAKQIVQDFNIQWNPGPAAALPAPAVTNQHK